MLLEQILRIVFRPRAAWAAVRAADPPWSRSLLRYVLPIALLPATAWPLGQAASGQLAGSQSTLPAALAAGFTATLALSLACVLLLALGIYLLAGFFRSTRSWNKSVAISAYSSTPVLLCGALLFVPILAIASVGALIHGLVLCSLGLNEVLGCRDEDCAAYVASAAVFTGAASVALGALCSAAGLI